MQHRASRRLVHASQSRSWLKSAIAPTGVSSSVRAYVKKGHWGLGVSNADKRTGHENLESLVLST